MSDGDGTPIAVPEEITAKVDTGVVATRQKQEILHANMLEALLCELEMLSAKVHRAEKLVSLAIHKVNEMRDERKV